MNQKRFAIVLLLFAMGLAGAALGQTGTAEVRGEVVYRNNKPAANCQIKIGDRSDFVDNNGRFRLLHVPVGNDPLTVTCHKHVVKRETVAIRPPLVKLPKIVLP